jgi:type I restriction enzyme S subunit
MKPEDFFEKFDHFADAPDAVEKIRELVLELAVQGKLVAQSTDDEPALEQLERIAAEKSKAGRVARVKALRAGNSVPVKSETRVPDGWEKASLSELVTVLNGRAYAKDELLSAGTPVLRVGNLFTSKHWYYSDLQLEPDKYCDRGDLIFAWSASFGPFIWPGPKVIYHYHIWKLDLHSESDSHRGYLYWFLQNKTKEIKRAGHGVSMLHMTKDKMEKLEVMVPPLAEQKRIVAKVEELMRLCDRLEIQQREREMRHAALARASLARFSDAPTPATLPFLFHPAYAISPADLRKSILTLAVHGKLAPQDSSEEPAHSLLKVIARKKQAMIKAKQVRQGKVSRPHSALDAPGKVPPGWEWVNLDSLCFKVTDGTHFTPQYVDVGVRFVSAKDIVGGKLVFDRCKYITREEHDQLYRRCNPEYRDIVVSKSGSIGSVALVEDRREFSLFESLALLKFDQDSVFPELLVYALTHACASLTAGHIRGVGVKHLHLDILRGLEIALPPFAEQRRIVAKVDRLMAMVDALETQLAASRVTAANLISAVVAEITIQS